MDRLYGLWCTYCIVTILPHFNLKFCTYSTSNLKHSSFHGAIIRLYKKTSLTRCLALTWPSSSSTESVKNLQRGHRSVVSMTQSPTPNRSDHCRESRCVVRRLRDANTNEWKFEFWSGEGETRRRGRREGGARTQSANERPKRKARVSAMPVRCGKGGGHEENQIFDDSSYYRLERKNQN